LEDSRRRISENDEQMLRRVREKEVSLDAERTKLIHDKNELSLEKESFAREKERIIKDKVQLSEEQEAFQSQTAELTKVGFEVQQKSEQVARLHENALTERLAAQQIRDEVQSTYLKIEKDKALLEDKELQLATLQKALEKQRVDIAKERKLLAEEKEEARKTIEAAKALSKVMQNTQSLQLVAVKDKENEELSNLMMELTPQGPVNILSRGNVSRNKENESFSVKTPTRREKAFSKSMDREEANRSLEYQQRFLHEMQMSNLGSSGSLQPLKTTLNPFKSSYLHGM
jgi:chromosome segregation ATPase